MSFLRKAACSDPASQHRKATTSGRILPIRRLNAKVSASQSGQVLEKGGHRHKSLLERLWKLFATAVNDGIPSGLETAAFSRNIDFLSAMLMLKFNVKESRSLKQAGAFLTESANFCETGRFFVWSWSSSPNFKFPSKHNELDHFLAQFTKSLTQPGHMSSFLCQKIFSRTSTSFFGIKRFRASYQKWWRQRWVSLCYLGLENNWTDSLLHHNIGANKIM